MAAGLTIATFRAEVTPPIGHPLCGGWLEPAVAIADPLYAHGIVLRGCGAPVVLCVIDFCEICNASHTAWRRALADAAGTTADRVAVHTMHPHCTPWHDDEAERIVAEQGGIGHVMDAAWVAAAVERVAAAARAAVPHAFTHIALGRALVDQVASNRRIIGADGKVKAMRLTRCPDPAIRAEPVGLVDPWLKTISFWNERTKLASLHFFAVHDTSYDNDRTITSDFTGHARERRRADEPDVFHAYFTECAGNIGAGKYNDGAPANRPVLADRVYRAMVEAEQRAERRRVDRYDWTTTPAVFPPRHDLSDAELWSIVSGAAPGARARDRIQAAMQLSYRARLHEPILLSRLSLGEDAHILGFPGETFIEYQLLAQGLVPGQWLAAASYADCGPGYICLEKSYDEGGYEPTDSFVSPQCESILRAAIARLLQPSEVIA